MPRLCDLQQAFAEAIIEGKYQTATAAMAADGSALRSVARYRQLIRNNFVQVLRITFCLSNSDQANLIASLVGRSLGFRRVVTSIGDPQFESICHELGLEDIIIPSRTIGRYLEDMVGGGENVELSTVMKDDARFFTLIVKEEDAGPVEELKLPDEARVICYYRDGKFFHADEESTLRLNDEVVILTHSKNMSMLQDRWQPRSPKDEPADDVMVNRPSAPG
jgi:trk system potassium uptake protein TrkA